MLILIVSLTPHRQHYRNLVNQYQELKDSTFCSKKYFKQHRKTVKTLKLKTKNIKSIGKLILDIAVLKKKYV